jgi:competence protein ComEA
MKLLIPALLCVATLALAGQPAAPAANAPANPHAGGAPVVMPLVPGQPGYDQLLDVNRASLSDLMKLPGVTRAVARRIVQGRPYLSKANLVTHKVISNELFQRIRSLVKVVELPAK